MSLRLSRLERKSGLPPSCLQTDWFLVCKLILVYFVFVCIIKLKSLCCLIGKFNPFTFIVVFYSLHFLFSGSGFHRPPTQQIFVRCWPRVCLASVPETTQIEDPRVQWRREQEHMLKDYLVVAQEALSAQKEIYQVKQQRLELAQQEYQQLHAVWEHRLGSQVSCEYLSPPAPHCREKGMTHWVLPACLCMLLRSAHSPPRPHRADISSCS